MDPNATWRMLVDAYRAEDWPNAKDAAEDLLVWIRDGGFPPAPHFDHPLDDDWNRALTEAACRFVLLKRGLPE
jgi:hypothetical protein